MQCADYRRWFSPYVDGLLEPTERASVEAHLHECSQCRTDLASLQQMLSSLRTMEHPATPDLLPGIHAQLEHQPWWRRIPLPAPFDVPWRSLALAGTAALAAILIVIPAYRIRRGGLKSNADSRSMQLSQVASQASQSFSQSGFGQRADMPKPVEGDRMENKEVLASAARTWTNTGSASKAILAEPSLRQEESSTHTFSSPLPTQSAGVASDDRERLSGVVADVAERQLSTLEQERADGLRPSRVAAVGASVDHQEAWHALADHADIVAEKVAVSPAIIQAAWQVTDNAAATAEMTEWVRAKDGSVVISDTRRLTITLPASAMADFLQRFPGVMSASREFEAWRINAPASSPVGMSLPAIASVSEERTPQALPPQVTISLELVPLQ